uniref:trace amine-associated receptor 1-like n=1 Tax=Doryrhamphus excisus TaxID=161450 RepID=UPI0025ADBF5B|nr:trace amine-associated receptor 1-like [Doryrhamphus excisus]
MDFIVNESYYSYFCNESEQQFCLMTITPSVTRMFLYMFVGSTMSISIICGNLLVITSIIYFKQLHTPTNYLILSLAVADLLLGALVLQFNMALSVNSCIYFGDVFCKMRRSFDISLMMTSILNLCCISIDRYYAVCQPLTYKTKINARVVGIMILVIWVFAAVCGFSIMFVGLKDAVCEGRCFIFHIPSSNIVASVISFYLPVIIMLCFYLKILTVALKQAQSIQSTKTAQTEQVSKMERKATKTLVIVMGVFLLCWTPFFLSLTFNPLSGYSIPLPLVEMLLWLGWSNSIFNTFVYGFFYSWFRAAFRIIISGKVFSGNYRNCKLH